MKAAFKKQALKVLDRLETLIEKCGGPGSGVPGPCPAGGSGGSGSYGKGKIDSGFEQTESSSGRSEWKNAVGKKVVLRTDTIYKKTGHQRDPKKTKHVFVVDYDDKPHKDFKAIGEDHLKIEEVSKKVAKQMRVDFGIDARQNLYLDTDTVY